MKKNRLFIFFLILTIILFFSTAVLIDQCSIFSELKVDEEKEIEEIEEDVEPQENGDDKAIIRIFGEFASFGELTKALEEQGIEISKAEIKRIANTPIELTDEQLEEVDVLIDKLEDDEDVQAVYTNIA